MYLFICMEMREDKVLKGFVCQSYVLLGSHNGIAQDWNSWPFGASRFDSWSERLL